MERDPDQDGFCGDGIVQVENGEECDDGNKVVTDGCVSEYQVKTADHTCCEHWNVCQKFVSY